MVNFAKNNMKFKKMISYCKDEEFVVFDTETTGLGNPANKTYCRLLEIGAVKINNDEIVEKFQTLVNPKMKIPKKITSITSITDDMVKDAPEYAKAMHMFKDFCGDATLIAHNAIFDMKYIDFYGAMCGLKFSNKVIDSLVLARRLIDLDGYKLSDLADNYDVLQMDAHRADDDAYVLAEVFIEMKKEFKEIIDSAPIIEDEPQLEKDETGTYRICSANYWEKADMHRIYVKVETNSLYVDTYYDVDTGYWFYKDKEGRDSLDFKQLKMAVDEYVENKKPILKKYYNSLEIKDEALV